MTPIVRDLGLLAYEPVWDAMRQFTDARDADTRDEIWLVQHPPVFTLGMAGRTEHVLDAGPIPVVRTDRGGQVTYHGPGQVVLYPLLDLRRLGLGPRALVALLEQVVIDAVAVAGVHAARRPGAPGVYVDGRKLAALGLRVRRGCSYHGLALNVDLDTAPFGRINPCGYPGLAVTRLADLGVPGDCAAWGRRLAAELLERLADLRTVHAG